MFEVSDEGFGLKAATAKFLPKAEDYTASLKQWVIGHNKKGDFRQYLSEMPPEMVNRYVADDSIMTLKLFLKFKNHLEKEGVNWRADHKLFMFMVDQLIMATNRGIIVDREKLSTYIQEVVEDISKHEQAFRLQHAQGIDSVESVMWDIEKSKRKTEKGKLGVPRPVFNTGSTVQLAALFVGYYRQSPIVFTEKGAPSFKSSHLNQWDGMEELQNVGKRELVLNQAKTLLEFSEYDGKWHQQLKSAGTVTGRYAGGGGLNIQALARRDKGLMSCLVAPEGYSFVSIDGGSMEPSIIAEYSRDKLYTKIIFGMKGIAPYWEDTTLILDDIYLSFLSSTRFGRDIMQDMWNRDWPAGSFSDQWLQDPDVIKACLKKPRAVAKMVVLAIGYGAGASKIFKSVIEAGFKIEKSDADNMVRTYKRLFTGIMEFSRNCSLTWEANHERVTNKFNYSMMISSGHKAANAIIQSSVNPIMQYFLIKLLEGCPIARYVTTIHDELIILVPDSSLELLKESHRLATVAVNKWLKWETITMSFGFAVGKTLYEAK
jgi:DNA polymerase I-like protein with 3'-5' exonuclease and polymerase domains